MASRSIDDLQPIFRARVVEWLKDCDAEGLNILVYCTLRSKEEQDQLFKIGRTVPGAGITPLRPMGLKVTNAKAGESAHNFGLALDFVPLNKGKPVWSDGPLYDKAIHLAYLRNIESLRGNPKFSELAHLQLPNWKSYVQ